MSVILAFMNLRQEDQRFKVIQSYIVRPYLNKDQNFKKEKKKEGRCLADEW
jgi:hypothetical protein